MVFGGLHKERIALTESTVWSGAPSTSDVNPEGLKHLDQIRQLLFQEDYVQAREALPKSTFSVIQLLSVRTYLCSTWRLNLITPKRRLSTGEHLILMRGLLEWISDRLAQLHARGILLEPRQCPRSPLGKRDRWTAESQDLLRRAHHTGEDYPLPQ